LFWRRKRSRCEVGFNNSPQDNTPYREQGKADESYFVVKAFNGFNEEQIGAKFKKIRTGIISVMLK
jgi:hypothetical protein